MDAEPGAVLRQARQRARLSQSDIARRSGIAQSVISTYESGRREPGVRTLARLVEATGHRLVLQVIPAPDFRPGLPHTPLGRRLRRCRGAVIQMAERTGARNVRVFGSVARGEDHSASDVDLLVDLDPRVGLIGLGQLEEELARLLGVEVDVVPTDSLRERLRDHVMAEAIPL